MARQGLRPGLSSLLLHAAWRIRLQIAFSAMIVLAGGFGAGWVAAWRNPSPSPPAAMATPIVETPIVEKVKTAPVPKCGPAGITRADVRLACNDGWVHTDEARLLGIDAQEGYPCKLSDAETQTLKQDEDTSVARTASDSRLCAPAMISADVVRLACKAHGISPQFARLLGIDVRHGTGFFGTRLCELSPDEQKALERDEAAAVKSR